MARGKFIVLAAVILFAVGGYASYQAWREYERKQVQIDMINAPGCSNCSHIKKDLAEKVRLREQQSE